jgi:hypothetical protein
MAMLRTVMVRVVALLPFLWSYESTNAVFVSFSCRFGDEGRLSQAQVVVLLGPATGRRKWNVADGKKCGIQGALPSFFPRHGARLEMTPVFRHSFF